MELRTYLNILQRRKWILAVMVVLATIIAAVATLLTEPRYVASTTVRVATYGTSIADSNNRTDINYSQLLMSTYASILTSTEVRREIREELGLEEFPQLTANLVPNTELMRIRAEAPNGKQAQDIANLAAEKLIEQSQALYTGGGVSTLDLLQQQIDQIQSELEQARAEYDTLLSDSPDNETAISAANESIRLKERTQSTLLEQYESVRIEQALLTNQITIVEPARQPNQAAKPRQEVNIGLGVIVGIVAGVALALIAENLDNTLYTVNQIESITESPTVGKIPNSQEQLKIIRLDNEFQSELEAFRRLRTNILATHGRMANHALLVTSAERGEGKSTILANLAVSLAQSGRRVLVIDCDLRRPVQHDLFNVSNKRGLTDILTGNMTHEQVAQESVYPRLEVITSGVLPPNPTELLGSPQMADLLDVLKSSYDVVLVDSPALLSVTDAAVLVPLVESVVLVVARARSRRDALREVRQQLSNVQVQSVNVVINRMEEKANTYAY